jgi:hypothetical protein
VRLRAAATRAPLLTQISACGMRTRVRVCSTSLQSSAIGAHHAQQQLIALTEPHSAHGIHIFDSGTHDCRTGVVPTQQMHSRCDQR